MVKYIKNTTMTVPTVSPPVMLRVAS